MAIFKMLNGRGRYLYDNSSDDVERCVLRPYKTCSKYSDGIHVDRNDPAGSMDQVAEKYKKRRGARLRHFVVSFTYLECPGTVVADSIGKAILEWIGEEYQALYAVHKDPDEIHLHVVFNSVSYVDGHKYRGNKTDYFNVLYTVKAVLRRYGIKNVMPKKR